MHICVVVFSFPARSETFVREHVEGLLRRGHQVTVVCGGVGVGIHQREVDELTTLGLKRALHPTFGNKRFLNFARMVAHTVRRPSWAAWWFSRPPWTRSEMFAALFRERLLREIRPDLVHVHFGTIAAPLHRVLAAWCSPRRMVVTWHGYDVNLEPKSRGKHIYRELFRGNYCHTVGSNFVRQRLLGLGGRADSISVVPMGVNTKRFCYEPKVLRNGEALRLVSVGRLSEEKGQAHLIRAVAHLAKMGERIALRIVGEGPARPVLEALIRNSGTDASAIQLLGAKTSAQIADELRQAHLFALPGIIAANGQEEGQGVVYAEAQACGLPVIASRVGGVPESVLDGQSGILCPPGEEQAIAGAIQFFLNHPERIGEFGRAGRRFVEENFSQDHTLDAFERLYAASFSQ